MKVEELTAYRCPHCYEIYQEKHHADYCLFNHLKEICINNDFEAGFDLYSIAYRYGLHWELNEAQKKITKDNCFTIGYLQCCDHPAYQISHISHSGKITVWGCGSWSGYYSSNVTLDCLKDPRPKEELFIDSRYK